MKRLQGGLRGKGELFNKAINLHIVECEMIKNVADMLQAFWDEERKKLDAQNITHPPTIGEMYEGLTKELLARTLPED